MKQFDRDVNVLPVIGDTGLLIETILKEDFSVLDAHPTYVPVEPLPELHFLGGSDLTYYFADRTGAVLNAAITGIATRLAKRSDKQITTSFDLDKEFNDDFEDLELIPFDFRLIKVILKFVKPNFGFDLQVSLISGCRIRWFLHPSSCCLRGF